VRQCRSGCACFLLLTSGWIPLQAATNETNQTVAEAERLKAEAEADRQALQEVRVFYRETHQLSSAQLIVASGAVNTEDTSAQATA
jgi:hypothetical protein